MERTEIETLLKHSFHSSDPDVRRALEYMLRTLTNNERAAVYLSYGEVPPHKMDKALAPVAARAFDKLAHPGWADGLLELRHALQRAA